VVQQAFGGLRGIPTVWGRPGGSLAAYAADPTLIDRDLPRCDGTFHHGATIVAAHALKGIEQFGFVEFAFPLSILSAALPTHSTSGPPAYENYPRFYSGAHEQMHITQIRRAYDGGLRLLTALAAHNQALEFAMSAPGAVLTTDRQIIEGLVCGMRRLVGANSSWMEIAYTPADAGRIIRANKLAVILGTEVDQLGGLGFASAQDEVDWLYGLGIRQVTPIHAIDNRVGGPAIFQDVYASQNDFQNRPVRDLSAVGFNIFTLRPSTIGDWTAAWFDVVEGGCDQGPRAGSRGECVQYRLNNNEARAFLYQPIVNGPPVIPFALDGMPNSEVPQYAYALRPADGGGFTRIGIEGHLNARGLSAYGKEYIRALMRRGMLVDIEHMSDRAASDTFAEAAAWRSGTTYPVMSSHTNFRSQSLQQDGTTPITSLVLFPTPHLEFTPVPGTTTKDFLPREFERSASQIRFIRDSGGMLGPMVGSDPIDVPPDQTAGVTGSSVVKNDCAASSKGFALQYLYAVQQMGGRGVGLATDMGAHPMTSPRFGPFACWVHATNPQREEQQFPALYNRSQGEETKVRYGAGGGLTPYTMAARTFDFNTDGLAHYGLLPDLLQDAKNDGVAGRDLAPLFRSAQDYITMWTKASRLATARPAVPNASVCTTWSEPPFP
jgi:microsomal dipeptidase-like Zn-dependent dipeptidase